MGNQYLFIALDYFTHWPESNLRPNQVASMVAKSYMYQLLISSFGVPKEICSDQGQYFKAELFQEICKLIGTHNTQTTLVVTWK